MSLLLIIAQFPPPGDSDNAWIYLCGLLGPALVYMFYRYDNNRTEELKRERERSDKLLDSLPEIVSIVREWKNTHAGKS